MNESHQLLYILQFTGMGNGIFDMSWNKDKGV